jgi:hypothetical protein
MRRRLRTALVAAWTVLVTAATAVTGLASAPAGAAAPTPGEPTVTRSAHIAYLSCPAPDVLLTVSIQRRPFAPGQLVTYRVSIRDLSSRPCEDPLHTPFSRNPAGLGTGLLGPCGELSVTIDNSRGVPVYPGRNVIACAMVLGPPVAAGQTITTTGTWDQTVGPAPPVPRLPGTLAPRGVYRLVVDDKVTLPFDLAGPSSAPPPAIMPPRSNPLPAPTTPSP